ncbi:MAG: SIMPL domain-containing protein [Candidatus Latescibacterota bacterium]
MRDWNYLILGSAIVLAATIFGLFHYNSRTASRSITTVGSASHSFDSDIVKWQLSVVRNTGAQNLAQGYSQLRSDITEVVNDLVSRGIERRSISIQPLNTNPIYEQQGMTGYRVQQSLIVVSDSLSLIEDVALNPDTIAARGIIIEFSNLQYFYSKVDSLKVALLGEATRDAERRAQEIAEVSDIEVGPIQSARAGVFQITEPYSTDVAAGGIYNTASREKNIRVTVHVTFDMR